MPKMKKIAVIYKSKYGTAEKYAKWIAEDTGAAIYKVNKVNINLLKQYNIIVYCGGLYAGGILGFSFIKKNYSKINAQKLIVVAVGATLKNEEAVTELKAKNIPEEIRSKVEFFLLRGGLNYPKMNIIDRFLMYLLYKSAQAKNKAELDDDTKGVIATYGKVVDFTSKSSIKPIIDVIEK